MEHFFDYHREADLSWLEEDIPAKASAFVSYTQDNKINAVRSSNINIKKRMREFLIKSKETKDLSEKKRCRRHMMSERMRREKQKHSYMRLHSLLPSGTKGDKQSIIITAAQKVEELKKFREELEKMNKVFGARENSSGEMKEAQININVACPSSGADSLLEVLKCLKQTNSNVTLIQSKLSAQHFSAVFGIQSKVGAAEIEKAVHRTLFEVEKKFLFNSNEHSSAT